MTTERQITTKIVDRIYQEGQTSFAIKYHGSPITIVGIPDLIGAWRGVPFVVEVKRPEEMTSGLSLAQKAWLSVFQRGGYVTGVVSSFEEFVKLFDKNDKVLYPDWKRTIDYKGT